MSGPNSGAEFLQQKYHLTKDAGVVVTANKKGIPEHKYVDRIQAYLDRVACLINPPPLEGHPDSGGKRAQRNIAMLKGSLYDHIIIKPEEVPPAYFQSIIDRHAEEGRPIPNIPMVFQIIEYNKHIKWI